MAQNPVFNKSIGYDFNDDYPVSGYGITIDTIQSWLVDNNLNTDAAGYNRGTQQDFDEATEQEVDDYIGTFNPTSKVVYVQGTNQPVNLLMMYDMGPGDQRKVIPSKTEIRNEIKDTINQLWDIPKQYQASLTKFLATYVSYINFCDYE